MINPHLPMVATIVEKTQETPDIFTIKLDINNIQGAGSEQRNDKLKRNTGVVTDENLIDDAITKKVPFSFSPGQFNMLYLYGVGEIPISIVSDPDDELVGHTIRVVGRVTKGMGHLKVGDQLGLRGPFGRGWPLKQAEKKDVVIVTGGLGCAPVVSVIHYIVRRKSDFGRLIILQGVKHSADLIWKSQYEQWALEPDVEVRVAASQSCTDSETKSWPWYSGYVTNMIKDFSYDPENTIAMMCGPEPMMIAAVNALTKENVKEDSIFLSTERNMQCAVGHCGHCQFGSQFICKQGPVFSFPEIKKLFGKKGW